MFKWVSLSVVSLFAYLLLWPVPVSPVAWQAPINSGYQNLFEANDALSKLELLPAEVDGPEDIAIDKAGRLYISTFSGDIMRYTPDSQQLETWVQTGGRPLGIEFDARDQLIVADAYRGLLSYSENGQLTVLTAQANEKVLRYVNDVDIADNGIIYFSDSSTKFGAEESGGTYQASLLDILEHGAHGRLLSYNPATKQTRVEVSGLNFANGVALSFDQQSVLVNETGSYRIQRYILEGERAGQLEMVIENLPGFPDNLSRGLDGKYWLGLVSPRSPALDLLSDYPTMRKVVRRLPEFIRPKARRYAHVVAFDDQGDVVKNLQHAEGDYAFTTGVTETKEYLYISSLKEQKIARLAQ